MPCRTVLVIPCYNEAARLRPERFRAFLSAHPEVSLLFVDDGSTDGTAEALGGFEVLRLARNRGKGEAVRQGVLHCLASGRAPDYVGFLDADLAVDPCEATRLTEALAGEPAAWMACASRWRRLGAEIRRAPLRAALGRLMAALVSLAVGAAFYDSQCGAKVFRAEVADILFGAPFLSRWLFDVELLLRLCSGVRQGAGR